jgi:hypothetical protein
MIASNIAFQRLALPASRTTIEEPLPLPAMRAQPTGLTFLSPYLSEEEQLLLVNHRIHEYEDAGQLARWLTNTPTALARRQMASPPITISLAGHVV